MKFNFSSGDVVVFPDVQVWDCTYPKRERAYSSLNGPLGSDKGALYQIRSAMTYTEKFIKEVMSVNEFDFISVENDVYGENIASIGYVREDGGYTSFLAPIEMMRLKDKMSNVVDEDSLFDILGL